VTTVIHSTVLNVVLKWIERTILIESIKENAIFAQTMMKETNFGLKVKIASLNAVMASGLTSMNVRNADGDVRPALNERPVMFAYLDSQ